MVDWEWSGMEWGIKSGYSEYRSMSMGTIPSGTAGRYGVIVNY
ncbi:hypothetical protein Mpsy_0200 [Methanolobus psychrophilus R15]|nr:hypothetical protein Mpsy_0200 [Methanolobus psychrophilus R15]